jgi:hypothetical protein
LKFPGFVLQELIKVSNRIQMAKLRCDEKCDLAISERLAFEMLPLSIIFWIKKQKNFPKCFKIVTYACGRRAQRKNKNPSAKTAADNSLSAANTPEMRRKMEDSHTKSKLRKLDFDISAPLEKSMFQMWRITCIDFLLIITIIFLLLFIIITSEFSRRQAREVPFLV